MKPAEWLLCGSVNLASRENFTPSYLRVRVLGKVSRELLTKSRGSFDRRSVSVSWSCACARDDEDGRSVAGSESLHRVEAKIPHNPIQ